jgi:hypothetical protein
VLDRISANAPDRGLNKNLTMMLLCYGYGYKFKINRRGQRNSCENINELRLVQGTMNPLIYSIVFDRQWLTDLLLTCKPDVNITDNQGNTALIYAVQDDKKTALVRRLIEVHKAKVHLKNHVGQSSLDLASTVNRPIIESCKQEEEKVDQSSGYSCCIS